jgi:PAS domain S-box-containing protein
MVARDGEHGLEIAQYARPDLILLDVLMPGMDGFEACRRLKAEARTAKIPVIFLSALHDTFNKTAGFAAGGVDYITKPFQVEEILARVRTHIALRRLQEQLVAQNADLRQEIARREQAEQALRRAHDELEQRVVERTAELSQANAVLREQILERERAEAALAQERNLLRTLIENLPDHVYIKDAGSRFVLANMTSIRSLGATALEEVIGKTDFDFHPPELARQFWANEQAILQSGQPLIDHEEYVIDRRTGHVCWLSSTKVPFWDSQGQIVGLACMNRDITQRKQTEDELRKYRDHLAQQVEARTAQLQALNAELTQYAYAVSHDLKAPLRAIHNYADFLEQDLAATLHGDQKMYLDGLVRAVGEAEELVQDLLELSRIDHHHAATESIDLGVFLRAMIASLDLPPDVEVTWDADWPTIESDPILLRQIFQNLLLNAVKFNRASPRRITLGCRAITSEQYEVSVQDNGIGIAERYQAQIFRVFQRLHTRQEYEGTGIGLAIVQKAVTTLQGTVRVESQAGVGSTFFVALPRRSDTGE